MPEPFKKVRYPAHLVKHLKKYPVRYCANPLCGRQLTPKVFKSGLEQLSLFKLRETCGFVCRDEKRAALKATEQQTRKQEQKTSPPKEAVQDNEKEPSGLVEAKTSQTSPPEPAAVREALGKVIDKRRAAKSVPKKPPKPKPKPAKPKALDPAPKPTAKSTTPGTQTKLPDPRRNCRRADQDEFLSPARHSKRAPNDPKSVNLLLEERAKRIADGTFDPTPGGGLIVIDRGLRNALVQALRHHDPDFIEQWELLDHTNAASRETLKYAGAVPA
jgi:hypothetical protein